MKCQKSKIFDHVRKKQNFFQTKGQGLSLNTIIIAAIVLIVLIVLWAIFTGRMGGFTTGVKEQTDIKECLGNWKDACEEGEIIVPISPPAGEEGKICCKAAGA